jgi:hypothetical protein
MQIGILTFHEGLNHGAFFQAYSLLHYLLEHGYQAEIINYKNKVHYLSEIRAILTKHPIRLCENLKKSIEFRKDQKSFISTPLITNRKYINIEKYDTIIIGSDIVWNYTWDFIGHDPIYCGNGLEKKKLVAYAPSCGDADIDNIPEYVRLGLPRFFKISVRDYGTAKMISEVLGVKPPIVADPVLIYDFTNIDIREESPYLLVYAYSLREKEIENTLLFAKKYNLKTISVGYYNVWCDKNIIGIGPFEWLGYVQHAQYVVTSTFHGTIFSIKYNKIFVTSNNNHIYNKLSYILDYLGLKNRLVNDADVVSILEENINYQYINPLLSLWIQESQDFLINALK